MSYNADLQTNNASLQSILDAVNALPDSDSSGVELPTLSNEGSASNLLSGKQLIDSDGNVVTGTMATVTQATPSISVSSSGLITASATQSAGYVSSGTKSATKQLSTQAAQTITPGTSNRTISSGKYLTGTQTIKGDSNLVAGNIKSGVSIFGVAGSYTGSGSGGADIETCQVTIVNGYDVDMSTIIYTMLDDTGAIQTITYDYASNPESTLDITCVRNTYITFCGHDLLSSATFGYFFYIEYASIVYSTDAMISIKLESSADEHVYIEICRESSEEGEIPGL